MLTLLWHSIVAVLVVMSAVPVITFVVQVVLSSKTRHPAAVSQSPTQRRPSLALLVPAHDEAAGIATVLAALRAQMAEGDRLLVVADNCTDDTAELARRSGAEVLERHDAQRRGKGYALAYGVAHLRLNSPEVLVLVDADCLVHAGALDSLARAAMHERGPAQAAYLMHAPEGAGVQTKVSEFAWLVRNLVRPSGLAALGGPCQLMGSGMAFRWSLVDTIDFATGHLAEDMLLGTQLALQGCSPRFCPQALVTSTFPTAAKGLASQRKRWEQGHFSVMFRCAPALWLRALTRGDAQAALMALDLGVPPVASLVLMLGCLMVAALADAILAHQFWTLALTCCFLVAVLSAIGLAWWRFARGIISARDLAALPGYVFAKVPLYWRLLTGRRSSEWVRTARDHDGP